MQFIIDFLVAGLLAYLSFTNFLATQVGALLGEELPEPGTEIIEQEGTEETAETAVTPLPSRFSFIPDILRNNAAYQAATAINSLTPPAEPVDPTSALANIYCTFTTERTIRTTTGTGFFVAESGIILTNAHVAQFMLLEGTDALGDSECTVRIGSPAAPRYVAELLYIPPAWITEHATLIDTTSPSGTGERDYALLTVTKSLDGSPLPARFPALPIYTKNFTRNTIADPIVAAGYPAGIDGADIDSDLLARQATTSITELFTFGTNSVDVLALRGSSIGHQGASGGPVVNADGLVIGMIATRGDDTKDGAGSLRAISIDHISRTIEEETGVPLANHLSGDVAARATIFRDTMKPFLTQLLTEEID